MQQQHLHFKKKKKKDRVIYCLDATENGENRIELFGCWHNFAQAAAKLNFFKNFKLCTI